MPSKMLELFSGSQQISHEAKKRGYDIRNLDISPKNNPTYCCDIITWDYKEALKDFLPIDVIWASPDCRSWSIAQLGKHRTSLEKGMRPKTQIGLDGEAMVLKTLEIIEWVKPRIWIIENPRGYLRHFPPMTNHPYRNTVYYGNWDYPMHKATDLFSNKIKLEKETKPQKYKESEKHKCGNNIYYNNNKSKRSLIPQKLISHIFDQL